MFELINWYISVKDFFWFKEIKKKTNKNISESWRIFFQNPLLHIKVLKESVYNTDYHRIFENLKTMFPNNVYKFPRIVSSSSNKLSKKHQNSLIKRSIFKDSE